MNDESQDVSKADISRLKMLLLHGNKEKPLPLVHMDALKEIASLGQGAESLIPLVLELYRENRLKAAPSSLANLYLAIPKPEILDALRMKGDFTNMGLDEKCELLKWGIHDVEKDLLAYIWENWKRAEPWRSAVVRALAIGGSPAALEMLEVIRVELAGLVPEKRAQLPPIDEEESIDPQIMVDALEVSAHEDFLRLVREGVQQMKQRLGG